MEPLTTLSLAQLGMNVAGAGVSWWQRAGVASKLFDQGRELERQIRRETDEAVRRLRRQQNETVGQAMVAGGASGIEWGSSSLQDYLRDMTDEFGRQAAWMRETGYRAARERKRAAFSTASGLSIAKDIGLFTDLGGALFQFGAANNWWQDDGETSSAGALGPTPGTGGQAEAWYGPRFF